MHAILKHISVSSEKNVEGDYHRGNKLMHTKSRKGNSENYSKKCYEYK